MRVSDYQDWLEKKLEDWDEDRLAREANEKRSQIETDIKRCTGCETHTMHELVDDVWVCLECGEER